MVDPCFFAGRGYAVPFKRMLKLQLLSLLLIGWGVVAASQTRAAEPARPHIVVFLADDLGWADCSINRADRAVATPNMDRLAAVGMTFTHAFVNSPSCAPSRAALLTGLTPPRNGAMFNHAAPRKEIKRWPAYFQELGYEVAAIGKVAHYAQVTGYGFDYASHFKYHQDECIEEAVVWLQKRESKKPLCLLVGTNWPHVPWPKRARPSPAPLPEKLIDTPETRAAYGQYLTAVARADRDLGRIYDAVQQTLGPDTLFLFTSDHGAQLPFGKWNCYDTGLRTPLIVAWPDQIRAGAKSDALVNWIDLLPTLLEAAGGTPPRQGSGEGELSGHSFLGVLRGKAKTHDEFVFATHSGDGRMNHYPIRSVRSRDFHYLRNLLPQSEHHTHIDRGNDGDGASYWRSWVERAKTDPAAARTVKQYHTRPAEELYDLRSDPHEQHNLAADPAHAQTLAMLRAQLDAWMERENDDGSDAQPNIK